MGFSLDLSNAVKNIKKDKERVIRGSLFSISSMIIKSTPVGNPSLWAPESLPAPAGYTGGSLRGAWNASVSTPDRNKSGQIDKNGASTAANAAKTINSFNVGQKFYLTNPLPYAQRVEFGWSQQAPQGMVRLAVKQAQKEVDKLSRKK